LPLLAGLGSTLERILSPPVSLRFLPAEYQRLLGGAPAHLKSIVIP
jgi:hypothetical protein